jgi:hypothetical protein
MIVSKNGTSYDTSDGSQQPHAQSAEGLRRSDREQINRWEDDGPGPHAHTTPAPANLPDKPAWSVLSLTNLLEAIRQLRAEPTQAEVRRQQERARQGRLSAEQDVRDVAAAAADAARDRHRNVWENT